MTVNKMLLGEQVATGLCRERAFLDKNYPLYHYNDEKMCERYQLTHEGIIQLMDTLLASLHLQLREAKLMDV